MRSSHALLPILAAALLGASALTGCKALSIETKRDPNFRPTVAAPTRVAVLRFQDKSGGLSPFVYPFLPFIWLADLVTLQIPEATPDSEKGAQTLRALLIARLRGSPLNAVDPAVVDNSLGHAGLIEKAYTMDPRELGRLLGVDAVLYGTLDDWSGRYYGVESHTVVDGTVVIRSCIDGAELFRAKVSVTDAAGVSGGPTGYISAAATPLAALGTGQYRKLAIDWTEAVGMTLTGEYSSSAADAAVPAPYITNVGPSPSPPEGFKTGDVIEVIAIGSPGGRATFDIGTLRVRIPMVENSRSSRTGVPDPTEQSAVYAGAYVVRDADRVKEAPVIVTIESAGGRAMQEAPKFTISIAATSQVSTAQANASPR